ncbi:MAG: hypothetical protein ACE15D_03660 [Candidatus Eisenbacteria bacterium]
MTAFSRSKHAPKHPWLATLAFLLLFVGLSAAAPAEPASEQPDESSEQKFRNKGWILDRITIEGAERPGVRRLHATGRIALPAFDVWRIIAYNGGAKEWPSVKESIVEKSVGDTLVKRYTVSVPVFKDRRYRLQSIVDDQKRQVRFELVPGYGNVREIRGSWTVLEISDSLTTVLYQLDTDPGVKLIPGFIVSWATKHAVPRLYEFIHDQGMDGAVARAGMERRRDGDGRGR